MKIVVLDGFALNPGDLSWQALNDLGEVAVYDRTSQEKMMARVADADAIILNKVVIDEATMKALPKLKYIGVLATGVNVVDIAAAHAHGIVVTNVPAYSTSSVVQSTFAHILNITNRVGHYTDECRQGRWSKNADFCYWNTPLRELASLTIGLVGLGNIGKGVAHIARSFGMEVFAFTSKNSADLPEGIHKTTFNGLLSCCDILSLHCPLTEKNYQMIDKKAIEKMRRGTILINTARGALVNENDVAEALHSGQLGAYGADVMCVEPPQNDNPLFSAPNAFITPHIAWATGEARLRLMATAVENLKAFVDGKPQNVV